MRVLVAEDDSSSRLMLEGLLKKGGYEAVAVADGDAAWQALQDAAGPELVLLDWMMPGMDGPEICRRVREIEGTRSHYIILLTARMGAANVVEGLNAGADDYVAKPYDAKELLARIGVGARILELQSSLAARVRELQEALEHIKTLQGILPVCTFCHRVRDDKAYWQQVEIYVERHSGLRFTHGVCPECLEKHFDKGPSAPPKPIKE